MARKIKIPNEHLKRYARQEQKRKLNIRNKRIYYLIVCEGEATEPNYFEGLKQDLPNGVLTAYQIDIEGTGRNTQSLVDEAIRLKAAYEKNTTRPVDKLWVVFVGYLIKTAEKNFRRTGSHELPDAIVFETVEDYIGFIGRKREWKLFMLNYEKVIKSIPQLKAWVLSNCVWLTDAQTNWDDILKVCHYFLDNPRPNLYLRQLPIAIHTKFIEDNVTIIQSMLDFLIPYHIRNHQQKRFAERYFLKYDEPLIRIRMLDTHMACFGNFSDISIPLSDFEKLDLPARNVLITENKMNFLTLPAMPSTIVVWSGGGFNISYLRNVCWLSGMNILYWGDIDEHGFQILHQLRSYYPQAKSVLMDYKTYEHFSEFAVVGSRNKSEQLSLLNDEEHKFFKQLKLIDKNRLEQEKISQVYVEEYLRSLLKTAL